MKITMAVTTDRKYNSTTSNSTQNKAEVSTRDIFEQMKKAIEESRFETEEQKKGYEDELNQKIKCGKKLSVSDMEYIRRTNPTMYMHVMRAQLQREMTVKQLEDCKSKKQVRSVQFCQLASIDKKDPDKEMITAAVNDAVSEYKKTNKYKSLPEELKTEKKAAKKDESDKTKQTPPDIYQYKESLAYAMLKQAKLDLEV